MFQGKPEDVINFFHYIAQEVRELMAKLGYRTINEMVGRADRLKTASDRLNAKTATLDLGRILKPAFKMRPGAATYNVEKQDHLLDRRVDNKLIELAMESLENGKSTKIEIDIVNTDRSFGTTLSYEISRRYGERGLPDETIWIKANGSAGQSLAAFLAPGVLIELEGDANDYVGKGLSGGRLIVYSPKANSQEVYV
jgi:glutamate synthase (NADPH/NADH)